MKLGTALGSALALGLAAQSAWAEGDAAQGERVFNRCKVCHTIELDGAPKQGPNLFGVYGSPAGTNQPGSLHSGKLEQSGVIWDDETLAEFLAGPSRFISGVRMTFRLTRDDDIANVIAYLKANRAEPE
ncbi:MAG: c-type cytochrome [Pseudomonadota bacterium]